MAGTWVVTITPLDVSRKEARVSATRTDGADVRTFIIATAILATTAQKNAALDQIWQMYQDDLTRDTAVAAYIGGLEAAAKTNLEARE